VKERKIETEGRKRGRNKKKMREEEKKRGTKIRKRKSE
jgi:hypothetical protein